MKKKKSPDTFDEHCIWLLKKMKDWQKKHWAKNPKTGRQRMNYYFRKELAKNTRLVKEKASMVGYNMQHNSG